MALKRTVIIRKQTTIKEEDTELPNELKEYKQNVSLKITEFINRKKVIK